MNLISKHLALLLLLLGALPVPLAKGWDGLPFEDNAQALTVYGAIDTYNPYSQLVAAVNEKCLISGYSPLQIVQDVEVRIGTTNDVKVLVFASGFYVLFADENGTYQGSSSSGPFASVLDPNMTIVNDAGTYKMKRLTTTVAQNTTGFVSTNWTPVGPYGLIAGETTGFDTITNVYPWTTNVTVTNTFGEFTSGSVTGFAYMTHQGMLDLDSHIEALIPRFLATNELDSGDWQAWFATSTNANNYPADFPDESVAGRFARLGIGHVTNLTYGLYDTNLVTGGDHEWTRYPAVTKSWSLAESTWTDEWDYHYLRMFPPDSSGDKYFNRSTRPVIQYVQGGTNDQSFPVSCIVSGKLWDIPTQSQYAGTSNETVAITSTNPIPLTERWSYISSLTVGSSGVNTGDWINVRWTNAFATFGAAPWRPTFRGIDERYYAINGLSWRDAGSLSWDTSDTYWWPWSGAATWADELTAYAAESGSHIGDLGHPPEEYVYAQASWLAAAYVETGKLVIAGMVTNVAHGVQAYVEFTPVDGWPETASNRFDAFTSGVAATNYYQYIGYVSSTTNSSVKSAMLPSSIVKPSGHIEPTPGEGWTYKGWKAGGKKAAVNYDVEW